MTETAGGFLKFEVGGQVFAILMAELAGIREITGSGSHAGAQSDSTSSAAAAPIDLGALFFGATASPADSQPGGFIAVVRNDQTMVSLRVDRVRAGTDMPADERREIPPMLQTLETPFSGMFTDPEGWGLIIDTKRLADLVRQRHAGQSVEYLHDPQ